MAAHPALDVTQASLDDVKQMLGHALREEWNPGLDDASSFFAADPSGFFVGRLRGEHGHGNDGRILSMASGVVYPSGKAGAGSLSSTGDYGFVGLYIVDPAYRGRGYGLKTFNHVMDRLKQRGCSCIGLDGVMARVEDYKRSGFHSRGLHERYGFDVSCGHHHDPSQRQRHFQPARPTTSSQVELRLPACTVLSLSAIAFDIFVARDYYWFGYDRSSFLKALMEAPDSISLVAVVPPTNSSSSDVAETPPPVANDEILGYVIARPSMDGYRIGPLFAVSDAVATSLVAGLAVGLAAGARGVEPLHVDIDVPVDMPGRKEWIAKLSESVTALLGDDKWSSNGADLGTSCSSVAAASAGRSGCTITTPSPAFACARMYTSVDSSGNAVAPPRMQEAVVYGNTTLELG